MISATDDFDDNQTYALNEILAYGLGLYLYNPWHIITIDKAYGVAPLCGFAG